MAQEGAPISVNVNMARILRINAPAATVIVGNPGIADVTIQDPQTLVLTGKSFGQTNLIVLDSVGNPIADTLVEVVQMQAGVLTVYQGADAHQPVLRPSLPADHHAGRPDRFHRQFRRLVGHGQNRRPNRQTALPR